MRTTEPNPGPGTGRAACRVPARRPARPSRPGAVRRAMAITGAAIAATAALGACRPGDLAAGPDGRRRNQERADYTITAAVTALDVASATGDITVTEADRSGVRVVETLHWRGGADARPRTRREVKDGVLVLRYRCRGRARRCSVDYRVEVPRGLAVKVSGGAGTIALRGLSGNVTASTGAGRITGEDLAAKRLVGESGAGDVEVRFGTVPDDVRIDVGAGNGVVHVPPGRYAVTTEAQVGERRVEVERDGSAPHRIVVRSGAGDVRVLRI